MIFDKKFAVSSQDDLFHENLGLAEMIALEYTNIPGAIPDDAVSEAHQALLRASRGFDSRRGEFAPYAARAVRNSLNSLYAKHLRIAQIFPKSLDDPPEWAQSSGLDSVAIAFMGKFADSGQNVVREVKRRETFTVLEEILNSLAPRERIVIEGLRSGRSLSEIGESMGISKQAVHKISSPALQKLRQKLDLLGYRGMDSLGLLKTSSKTRAKGAG